MTAIQTDRTLRVVYNALVTATSGEQAAWAPREAVLVGASDELSPVSSLRGLNRLEDIGKIERDGDFYRAIGGAERIPNPNNDAGRD